MRNKTGMWIDPDNPSGPMLTNEQWLKTKEIERQSIKVSKERYEEIYAEWKKIDTENPKMKYRLGQHFINSVEPRMVYPELFYESRESKCHEIIVTEFIDG